MDDVEAGSGRQLERELTGPGHPWRHVPETLCLALRVGGRNPHSAMGRLVHQHVGAAMLGVEPQRGLRGHAATSLATASPGTDSSIPACPLTSDAATADSIRSAAAASAICADIGPPARSGCESTGAPPAVAAVGCRVRPKRGRFRRTRRANPRLRRAARLVVGAGWLVSESSMRAAKPELDRGRPRHARKVGFCLVLQRQVTDCLTQENKDRSDPLLPVPLGWRSSRGQLQPVRPAARRR
jgi:hypothetical protein